MAEKQLNTRIQLKYDTYSNWTTKNPVLKAGEMAIATIASGNTQEVNSVTAPQVLIKVGDGTSNYTALPFVSAKSADVYSWAKADKKPTYAASEITGISEYIAEYVESEMGISVDTDTQYQIVAGADAYTYKLQSKGKGDTAWADVSTITIPQTDISGKVDKVNGKGLSTNDLTDALKANYDTAYNHSQSAHAPSDAQANVIEKIKVNGTEQTVTDKAVDITVPTEAQIKSIAATEINTIVGGVSDVDTIENITTLVNYVNEHGADTAALVSEVYGSSETTGTSRIDTLEDKVDVEKVSTAISSAIEDANLSQYAKDADLAAIAKTGNVNDLVQTTGDVLIFNCGNATF